MNETFILIGQITIIISALGLGIVTTHWTLRQFEPTLILKMNSKKNKCYFIPKLFIWDGGISENFSNWLVENKPNWLIEETEKHDYGWACRYNMACTC